MTSTGAWGTLFTIERALIGSLSNGLKRQLTKVIPVARVTAMTELQALPSLLVPDGTRSLGDL